MIQGRALSVLYGVALIAAPAGAQSRIGAAADNRAILTAVKDTGSTCQMPVGEDVGAYGPPAVEWRRDINGDGRPEALVVEGGTYCYGNTGQAFWLLTQRSTGVWTVIAQETGIATLLKTTGPGGWPDLEVGGPGLYFPVLRWSGTRYQPHGRSYDGKPCGDEPARSAITKPPASPPPAPTARRSKRRASSATHTSPPPAPQPAAAPVLRPFDTALANPAAPLSASAMWSGVALVSSTPSVVTLQIAQANGKLSGTASVRPTTSAQAATLKVDGRVKDGICQIKIESLSSFKGSCNSAGFVGRKKFLGTLDASIFVYTGGAEAMARAGAALPATIAYGGKSVSIDGAFPMDQFILMTQSGGVLSGTHRNLFVEAGIAGAAFDGSCVVLTTGVTSFQGTCSAYGFRGMSYSVDKPDATVALRPLSPGELSAAVNAKLERSRQAMAAIEQQRAAAAPPPIQSQASGNRAPPTVTATGRARILVEPGGSCGPDTMLRRGYCFGEAIDQLRRNPNLGDVAVVATRTPLPLGARIGAGEYDYVTVKRRPDGSFSADKTLHGTSKIRIPQGCLWRGTYAEGFVIALAEGGKKAVEVADYLCG